MLLGGFVIFIFLPMKKHIAHMHKYAAEFVGAFFLTLAVSLSLAVGLPLATPIMAALTIAVFVYVLGPVSGAHFNPAVTIGLLSIKKISGSEAVGYIVAQVAAAFIAGLIATSMTQVHPVLIAENTPIVGLAEALGAFVLVFGIASVVYGKVNTAASGLTIGGSLLVGVSIAGTVSNGVINPAVALGIGSVSLMYIVAPLIGAVLGAWAYKTIQR